MSDHPFPVFHANIVTLQVAADEISLEFREYLLPHQEMWTLTEKGSKPVPTPSDAEIYQVPPAAKVVITYTAAKFLQANLNALMPQVEEWRRQSPQGLPQVPGR